MGEGKPVAFRQKLLKAMESIGSIAKEGKNEKQNYAFQRASDILAATQQAFVKHELVFLSDEQEVKWLESHETQGGATMFAVQVTMRYCIMDATGPLQDSSGNEDYRVVATHSGVGFDTSDKALNKAKTQSLKYFLKGTFLIGEDDDEDDADKHHIEAKPKSEKTDKPACPKCGAVGTIIKGKAEYGGGWLCFGKKGGCGAKFTMDPAHQVPPPPEPEDESRELLSYEPSEDDWKAIDAAAATFPGSRINPDERPTEDEIAELMKLLEAKHRKLEAALKWVGAKSLDDLSKTECGALIRTLKAGK